MDFRFPTLRPVCGFSFSYLSGQCVDLCFPKCEGFCVCVVRHVMSLNSVQSFMIENCNGPTIENGPNNVCLHPLSRTFTFTCKDGVWIYVFLLVRMVCRISFFYS